MQPLRDLGHELVAREYLAIRSGDVDGTTLVQQSYRTLCCRCHVREKGRAHAIGRVIDRDRVASHFALLERVATDLFAT